MPAVRQLRRFFSSARFIFSPAFACKRAGLALRKSARKWQSAFAVTAITARDSHAVERRGERGDQLSHRPIARRLLKISACTEAPRYPGILHACAVLARFASSS
jgi:hypothetical protein